MTLAPPAAPGDALAPLLLPEDLQLTAEQFAAICQVNPNAVLELDASGRLIHMTPTGSETGARNSRLVMRLLLWADQQGAGVCLTAPAASGCPMALYSVLMPPWCERTAGMP